MRVGCISGPPVVLFCLGRFTNNHQARTQITTIAAAPIAIPAMAPPLSLEPPPAVPVVGGLGDVEVEVEGVETNPPVLVGLGTGEMSLVVGGIELGVELKLNVELDVEQRDWASVIAVAVA